MVELPAEIKEIIDNYLHALKQHNIPVKTAVLFGSYAAGKYGEWSDIDIALVSDIFEGDRIADKDKIRKVTLSVSSAIDVIPFAPEDFTPQNPFVKEILRTGVKLV
ncbi:MAG: nucleotidyltransferase domain-containing protein [Calditrichaeota bacterium]|nr:MAG: nucleotidyltransferase domain-containing protein [Calditrichota bacterium]